MKTCKIKGCTRSHKARGYCGPHYSAARASGLPTLARPSTEERFWAKVDKSTECWLWTGTDNHAGYGMFRVGRGERVLAHRFAYEAIAGPIEDGKVLDHLCRTPSCVRPDHLEPVTQRENILRGLSPVARQARQTHCVRGHAFAGDNLLMTEGGRKRRCRECRDLFNAARADKSVTQHLNHLAEVWAGSLRRDLEEWA